MARKTSRTRSRNRASSERRSNKVQGAGEAAAGGGASEAGREDFEAQLAERDSRIAELEGRIADAAKSAETAEGLRAEIAALRRQAEDERPKFTLKLAGAQREGGARCWTPTAWRTCRSASST